VPAPAIVPPAPGRVGETVFLPGWLRGSATPAAVPDITIGNTFGLVLVISHDCEIDKEWNEWVEARIAEGMPEDQAEADADTRAELDARILVAPLLPYEPAVLPERAWEAVRHAQKIGYFPLPAIAAYGGAEFVVHLSRVCVIERALLDRRTRLISLTEEARQLLRFKLAEALSSRNLSVLGKLEAAVGHRIDDVRALKQRRSDVTAALVFDDGTELQVGVRAESGPAGTAARLPQRP
jgi:hypothetical protein